eukprot:NODE_22_length_42145_cov_1.310612.p14 type:complete len:343 gc:universal NODE_22_length_42145_cov_1.310612:13398-14426(+)
MSNTIFGIPTLIVGINCNSLPLSGTCHCHFDTWGKQLTMTEMKDLHKIKNKVRRSAAVKRMAQHFLKEKKVKLVERRAEENENPELLVKRLAENVPITIENSRIPNETAVSEEDQEDALIEESMDEFASYFNSSDAEPKILVTTSRNPSGKIYDFANEFSDIFPNCEFVKRKNFDVKQIVKFCQNRNYTDVIIINENNKIADYLTMIHLPEGPTAFFRLSNTALSKEIHNHGRSTAHQPELILNNFDSKLGRTVGRFLACLFPKLPEFEGRQVATFHNQRDFIFFRRHRYMFNHGKAVLQEIGPRFTLKLRWLRKGLFDHDGEIQFKWHPKMQVDRRKFFLS